MKHPKLLLLLLLAVCCCQPSLAQTNRKIEELKSQRGQLQEQIKQSESLLLSTNKDVKSQLGDLALINSQLEERRKFIKAIESEMAALDADILRQEKQLKQLQADSTGPLDREPWDPVVEAFTRSLSAEVIPATGERLDVRENVRFWGQNESRWTHRLFPDSACVLALEFKKTFMDEWTGEVDEQHLAQLAEALAGTVPAVTEALRQVKVPSP